MITSGYKATGVKCDGDQASDPTAVSVPALGQAMDEIGSTYDRIAKIHGYASALDAAHEVFLRRVGALAPKTQKRLAFTILGWERDVLAKHHPGLRPRVVALEAAARKRWPDLPSLKVALPVRQCHGTIKGETWIFTFRPIDTFNYKLVNWRQSPGAGREREPIDCGDYQGVRLYLTADFWPDWYAGISCADARTYFTRYLTHGLPSDIRCSGSAQNCSTLDTTSAEDDWIPLFGWSYQ